MVMIKLIKTGLLVTLQSIFSLKSERLQNLQKIIMRANIYTFEFLESYRFENPKFNSIKLGLMNNLLHFEQCIPLQSWA
jgi:hypothetical protein